MVKEMSKFYIAHKITIRHYVRDDICPFLHDCKIETVNPFYNSDGTIREDRPEVKAIDDGQMGTYNIIGKNQAGDIVERDLEKIRKADGIIAIIEESSIGTSMEIFYCARWCKKPVFVVTTGYAGHPWLIYLTNMSGGKIVKDKKELVKAIQNWEKRKI